MPRFTLESSEDIPEGDRYHYPVGEVEITDAVFEMHGLSYEEIPFEVPDSEGWITLDRTDASIELSLDLTLEDGVSVNMWGDFPITNTVFMT